MDLLNYLPNLWPVVSLLKIAVLPENDIKEDDEHNDGKAKNADLTQFTSKGLQNTATDLIARHLRLSTYFILAIFAYYVLPYPDITAELSKETNEVNIFYWSPLIVIRNVVMVGSLYGGWHYFLYENKAMRGKLRSRKFDQRNLDKQGNLITTKGYNWQECAFSRF